MNATQRLQIGCGYGPPRDLAVSKLIRPSHLTWHSSKSSQFVIEPASIWQPTG